MLNYIPKSCLNKWRYILTNNENLVSFMPTNVSRISERVVFGTINTMEFNDNNCTEKVIDIGTKCLNKWVILSLAGKNDRIWFMPTKAHFGQTYVDGWINTVDYKGILCYE
ncbi:hypothetical protein [Brevibacillus laterosporus]|uniref:hypothetical protein n=1 Tax=Brevibacillus laterosporus TaxID=1465 RepID=UPI000E6C38BF|nr:hypothetical protein [Brevibacillus laterosporus]AYB38486.1 hypothetical protein D5F52_09580 [Brevibacillus laterosporus]MBM7111071.1 hypothetical protein [Brevibacillus laterosporus]NKQ18464.1 hypothetical protein [Brevibacillus laterosporus]WNX33232.1 hypothetical protein RWW94_10735 [Brevibacillus laterosporus]